MPGCKTGDLAVFYDGADPTNPNNGGLMEVVGPYHPTFTMLLGGGAVWWNAKALGSAMEFPGGIRDMERPCPAGTVSATSDATLHPIRPPGQEDQLVIETPLEELDRRVREHAKAWAARLLATSGTENL